MGLEKYVGVSGHSGGRCVVVLFNKTRACFHVASSVSLLRLTPEFCWQLRLCTPIRVCVGDAKSLAFTNDEFWSLYLCRVTIVLSVAGDVGHGRKIILEFLVEWEHGKYTECITHMVARWLPASFVTCRDSTQVRPCDVQYI